MVAQTYNSRAWRVEEFKEFEGLRLSEPESVDASNLGPNQVLVKLKAASLNYRDLVIPRGLYPFPAKPGVIPGSDASALVVAVGDKVQEFKPGDKVITLFNQGHIAGPIDPAAMQTGLGGALDGTLREYAIFPETGLVAAPKNLNWEEAATLSCAALTSWNALFGLKPLKAGEYVLVEGTGGVSVFALQFAKAAGAYVVATTSTDEKAKQLRELGADHVINYKTNPEWGKAARAVTPDNTGFDHIIEVGGPNTLRQAINAVKYEGVISIIGFVAGDKHAKTVGFMEVLDNVCTVRGILVGSRQQLKEMVRAIEVNKLKPVVDPKIFEFEELKEAYQYMWDAKHFGKLVVKIDSKDD